jgi:hypothetical protein
MTDAFVPTENHPSSVMSTIVARSRKRTGGFWGNQTFNAVIVSV